MNATDHSTALELVQTAWQLRRLWVVGLVCESSRLERKMLHESFETTATELKSGAAKKTEICAGLTLGRESGERRPTVARRG